MFLHDTDLSVYSSTCSSKSCTKRSSACVTDADTARADHHQVPGGVTGVQIYRPKRHAGRTLALSLHSPRSHLSFVGKRRWQEGGRCDKASVTRAGAETRESGRRCQVKVKPRDRSPPASPSQRQAGGEQHPANSTRLRTRHRAQTPNCLVTAIPPLVGPWSGLI